MSVGIISLFILSAIAPMGLGLDVKNIVIEPETSMNDGGLMDSAWPMFSHNARHTGRSPNGKSGTWWKEKWNIYIGSRCHSSPAIDNNGIIYIGGGVQDKCLHAIYPNGTMKWSFKTGGHVQSSPAISDNGIIYFGSNDGKLYAVYLNGTEKWSLIIGDGWVSSSPVIDKNGIIYITSVIGSNICAVYPNGTIKWDYKTDNWMYSSPVIDDDTVYCGSHDFYLYALHKNNGTLKWKYKTSNRCGGDGATINDDGIIIFGNEDGYLYSLYPDGSLNWKLKLEWNIVSSPAISVDGSIYVAAYKNPSYGAYIYSIGPDGSLNWKYFVDAEAVGTSPAIDKYGIIYFGTWDGLLLAMNPDGTLRWSYKALDYILSSPVIGEDGTIYFGSHSDGFIAKLYAIEPVEGNSPPEIPRVSGPKQIDTFHKFTYTFETTDPDGDNVCFFVIWDDHVESEWTDYVPSGTSTKLSHKFEYLGRPYYIIKVQAVDEHGAWSDWATFQVNFKPRNKLLWDSNWLKFIDMFPVLQQLLSFIF